MFIRVTTFLQGTFTEKSNDVFAAETKLMPVRYGQYGVAKISEWPAEAWVENAYDTIINAMFADEGDCG